MINNDEGVTMTTTANPTITPTGRIDHTNCTHDRTKAGRTWCRRQLKTDNALVPVKRAKRTKPKLAVVNNDLERTVDIDVLAKGAAEQRFVLTHKLHKRSTKELTAYVKRTDITDMQRTVARTIISARMR